MCISQLPKCAGFSLFMTGCYGRWMNNQTWSILPPNELIDSWVMNMMVSWYKAKHTQHIGTYCIYKYVHYILYLCLEGRTSIVSTLNGILFPGDQHKAAYCSCRPAPYSNKERTVRATCIPCDRSQPPRSKCKMQDSLLSFSALELKLNNKLN